MSSDKNGRDKPPGHYEVGYRRPPKETRFKPGNQAARKGGRPKGRKNIATTVKEVASYRFFITMPDGASKKVTFWEAGFWNIAMKGVKNVKEWMAFTAVLEKHGIALPQPEPIDGPVTEDERAMAERYFTGWARQNPAWAIPLLRKLEADAPQPPPTRNGLPVEGRPTVRRIFFGAETRSTSANRRRMG